MATQNPARPPSVPSLSELQRQTQQRLQEAFENYVGGLTQQFRTPQYTPPPTFSASYFMPTNILNQMRQTLRAQPQVDRAQLRQTAQEQVNLLTTPQIEALRQQINQLRTMIPEERQALQQIYGRASSQLGQGVADIIAALVDQAQRQGGLRSGVYQALTDQAQQAAQPLFEQLGAAQEADIQQVIGTLEAEKQSAQNLLQALMENRGNMTEAQYNALYDQAVNRFRNAQAAQLQFLGQLANLESQARQQAATLAQSRADARNEFEAAMADQYNQFLQMLINARRGEYEAFAQQLAQEMQQRQAENLRAWRDYFSSAAMPTPAAALDHLRLLRNQVISSVGEEGYRELEDWLREQPARQINPNYTGPTIGPTPPGFQLRPAPTPPTRQGTTQSGFQNWLWNILANGLFGASLPLRR